MTMRYFADLNTEQRFPKVNSEKCLRHALLPSADAYRCFVGGCALQLQLISLSF